MSVENKRYKYDIFINQFACVENGFDLDLIDLAIFCYIKDFSGTNECLKMHTPEGIYFWISHSKLLEEMPLLKIKTKQGLIKRIDKLVKCNIFNKHPRCEHYAKTLYQAGPNYDKLVFTDYRKTSLKQELTPLNESLETPSTKVESTLNESLENNNHYNIIDINNNTINTNNATNVAFPKKFIELYDRYDGSKKDIGTEYDKWIEKCNWNCDYDLLLKRLRSGNKQPFQSWLNKFRTEPSKFPKIIIEEYQIFHEQQTGIKKSDFKPQEIVSLENISRQIESAVKTKLRGNESDLEHNVRQSIQLIFQNWNKIDNFYQKQIKPSQIESNLTLIFKQIKDAHKSVNKIGRISVEEFNNIGSTIDFEKYNNY